MGKECNLPKPQDRHVIQYFQGRGYAIVDPAGEVISGYSYQPAFLQDRLEKLKAEHDAKGKRGPRACLCCGDTFVSEGVHNRLCNACRQRDIAPDPFSGSFRRARAGKAA